VHFERSVYFFRYYVLYSLIKPDHKKSVFGHLSWLYQATLNCVLLSYWLLSREIIGKSPAETVTSFSVVEDIIHVVLPIKSSM
jgi:hypothetical protein